MCMKLVSFLTFVLFLDPFCVSFCVSSPWRKVFHSPVRVPGRDWEGTRRQVPFARGLQGAACHPVRESGTLKIPLTRIRTWEPSNTLEGNFQGLCGKYWSCRALETATWMPLVIFLIWPSRLASFCPAPRRKVLLMLRPVNFSVDSAFNIHI
jgi:hypothetical protein